MSELHRFLDEARGLLPAAVALRRRIHAKPELGLDLPLTTEAVLDGLRGLELDITRGPSTSGLVVSLSGTKPGTQTGRTILLRGDMDALPMPEETGLDYASEFAGRMHAFPRLMRRFRAPSDAAAAAAARELRDAACELIAARRSTRGDDLVSMLLDARDDHIWPGIKAGAILGKPGPMMAAADTWSITIKGRGGHASMPQDAVDPIPVAFEIGLALHALVTRRMDVFDPVVLTCTKVTAGTTNNVIPETVEMLGTLRSTSEQARERAHDGIRRVAANIAAAHRCPKARDCHRAAITPGRSSISAIGPSSIK